MEVKLAPLTTGRVAIKREMGEEEVEAGSPLREKLDRRENASPLEAPQSSQPANSKAISASTNQTSTANQKASSDLANKVLDEPTREPAESNEVQECAVKEEATEKDNLAIFDFTESSPVDTTRPRTADLARVARNARRHSSVLALTTSGSEKPEGTLPSLHKRIGNGGIKSGGATSLAKSTSAARLNAKKAASLISANAIVDGAAAASDAEKTSATNALRAERMASRRKSMML